MGRTMVKSCGEWQWCVCVCVCVCVWCVCTYACMYACMYVCMYVRIACMYICQQACKLQKVATQTSPTLQALPEHSSSASCAPPPCPQNRPLGAPLPEASAMESAHVSLCIPESGLTKPHSACGWYSWCAGCCVDSLMFPADVVGFPRVGSCARSACSRLISRSSWRRFACDSPCRRLLSTSAFKPAEK